MSKVVPKMIEDQLREEFMNDGEWWDYIDKIERNDWSDYDEHPWTWYMERDQRLHEGWQLVKINPMHKDVTVIYYLKSLKAKFKHSKNEFLIEDHQHAMMVTLKYA